jgi:two-component system, cell cycle response regulator DivK
MPARRILLVDDYRDALEVWEWYLRSQGYDVVTASNGYDAVRLAKSTHPDVIVMDLQLPGLSGCDAAREIRTTEPTTEIPLIAATGFSHDRQIAEARAAGFDQIVIKPCDPSQLVDEIERVLAARESGQPLSPDGN